MEKLIKIPQVTFKSDDCYGYKCTAYSDIISIEYYETDEDGNCIITRKFDVPTFLAKQLFEGLIELVDQLEED